MTQAEAAKSRVTGARTTDRDVVLCVDDDTTSLDLLIRVLDSEGLYPVPVRQGEDAVQLARELSPSVMTLDIRMPVTDGWSVLERLKDDPELRGIPVIIVSTDDMERGFALGACDFVAKPFDRDRLCAAVKQHCAARLRPPTVLAAERRARVRSPVTEAEVR